MEHALCKEGRQGCPSTSAATAPLCCCSAAPGAVFLSGILTCPGRESRSQQSEQEQHLPFPQTIPCLGSTRPGWSLWCPPAEPLSLCCPRQHWRSCAQPSPPEQQLPPPVLQHCPTQHSPVPNPALAHAQRVSYWIRRFTGGDEAQFPLAKEINEGEE